MGVRFFHGYQGDHDGAGRTDGAARDQETRDAAAHLRPGDRTLHRAGLRAHHHRRDRRRRPRRQEDRDQLLPAQGGSGAGPPGRVRRRPGAHRHRPGTRRIRPRRPAPRLPVRCRRARLPSPASRPGVHPHDRREPHPLGVPARTARPARGRPGRRPRRGHRRPWRRRHPAHGRGPARGVHRVLFRRIQELTLAGRTNPEIAAVLAEEATRAFGLLEPALADYARA